MFSGYGDARNGSDMYNLTILGSINVKNLNKKSVIIYNYNYTHNQQITTYDKYGNVISITNHYQNPLCFTFKVDKNQFLTISGDTRILNPIIYVRNVSWGDFSISNDPFIDLYCKSYTALQTLN